MEKVGFIGGADKTNLLIYIAKLLDDLNRKVLVIDATFTQKTRYIIPAINPTRSYITYFENIDFAVGFKTMQDLLEHLGMSDEQDLPYDYVLIDIDSARAIEEFGIEDTDNNFFVTTFDMYSLQRGVKILKTLPRPMTLSKILLNYNMSKDDEEYLLYLTTDARVIWNDFSIYMPILEENEQAMQENQRVAKARLKKLIPEYQEGIIYIVQNLIKDLSTSRIRKMIRE